MTAVAFTLNGAPVNADIEPRTSLADFLRHHQRLTGTHLGCEHGVCGSCTVMINGAPARSCIAFAAALGGCEIRTIEGFDADPMMERLRAAFRLEHGVQCGFCTPGMLITSRDIVLRLPDADEKRIRIELAGNLCRCTGYVGIVRSILRVIRELPVELRAHTPMPRPAPIARPYRSFTAESGPKSTATMPLPAGAASSANGAVLTEHFVVPSSRAEVWALFGDAPRMVRCMPGAQLLSIDGPDIKGAMRVAFGPIKATFTGVAAHERDPAAYSGTLSGRGSDEKRGSRVKGQVAYTLTEQQDGSTRTDISVVYRLQGPLAQFGRSGLLRDFSRRLVAEFSRNLAAELRGDATHIHSDERVGVSKLLWSILWQRLKAKWSRRPPSNT
jgi:aerobic carbon-monoxide dehydrogenase small subunit